MSSSAIQGLWIGAQLPKMQQISIASFLAHGHDFHLYCYQDLGNVPPGTLIKDAREIIPEGEIFKNHSYNTYAAFSDFFRYKLLLDKGGWWVDVDTICLRPFDFTDEYVFSSEHILCRENTNSGIIKAPRGCALMAYAWEQCRKKDITRLAWDEVGPELLRLATEKYGLCSYVQPALAFCPLDPNLWHAVMEPERRFRFGKKTYAVHLWHELWRRGECDVNAQYAPGSLYEQFHTMYVKREKVDDRHNVVRIE